MILFFMGCSTSSNEDEKMIKNSRLAVLELNKKYNQLYQVVMEGYLSGNKEFEAAGICLQSLTMEIINVNKALHIDCKQYGKNGNPQMIEDKNGKLSPIEIIPDELKIDD